MAEANRAETIRQIFAAYLASDRTFVESAFFCPGMAKREPFVSRIILIDMSVP
jgi:hypothetical protein